MNEVSTKDKILKVSHALFAQKGLHGVSVREIAKACDVNIAAINYHFKSKESLYAQAILTSMLETNAEIAKIYQEQKQNDPQELCLKIMDHFMDNSSDLRAAFIMFLSSEDAPKEMTDHLQKYKGPPGGEYLFQSIAQKYPDATEQDIHWVVRSVFGIIMHKSMVMSNKSICESMEDIGITRETFRYEMNRLMKVLLADLKKN